MLRNIVLQKTHNNLKIIKIQEHSIHGTSTLRNVLNSRCIRRLAQEQFIQSGHSNQVNYGSKILFKGSGRSQHLDNKIIGLCAVIPARFNSTQTPATNVLPDGYIPEPPALPGSIGGDSAETLLNALGEPTLASLGLANNTPAGLVQMGLENLHVLLDMPWWGAIIAGTLVLRMCVFPLVIIAQRNAANMSNHMPTVQRLQTKFTKCRASGNQIEAARVAKELSDYMSRNNVKPFRSMLVPFAQLPIFLSVFIGVRHMANLPVESMQTGGLLWFPDLTVADPFYILPLISMGTLLTTIELGVDGPQAAQLSHNMKWVFRLMPVFMFPFVMNFPAAMLCYWVTTNVFSLCQVMFLKVPLVRSFFNIPAKVEHDKSAMPEKKKFVAGFRESMDNARLISEMENRHKAEADRFHQAGIAPIQKTYSYDPTKVNPKKELKVKSKS